MVNSVSGTVTNSDPGHHSSDTVNQADLASPPRTIKRRDFTRFSNLIRRSSTDTDETSLSDADADADADAVAVASPDTTTDVIAGHHAQTKAVGSSSESNYPGEPDDSQTPSGEASRSVLPMRSVERARERGLAASQNPVVLTTVALTKIYGDVRAASDISFSVHAGSFTGVVGPNGAGKTTVLSMISGLNRPSSGSVMVNGIDVWADGLAAKRVIGSLPDRLRMFDRLTGAQLMYYFGVLQGVPEELLLKRVEELASAFGLESALARTVADYSAGMQKKIGLACAMIHAPDLLVLDEPFETIDPVSATTVTQLLEKFVAAGGSVVMSSHSLELIQRVCDHVVVINHGEIVASGTVDQIRDGKSLEERFHALTHTEDSGKGLEWLRASGSSV